MKKIRLAINGFGRIGRNTFRALEQRGRAEVVAINDISSPATLAHLLKYDSIHGRFNGSVSSGGDYLIVNGKRIRILSQRDPTLLPWKKLGADIVIESTGLFRDRQKALGHIKAGAKKVIISAPPSGESIKSIVLGVNHGILTGDEDILSNASCTTNCAAPLVKILDDAWGIECGYVSTIHAYTGDQRLHDAPHQDLRMARAAAASIIPTTTGAAKAITKIFPHLEGKMGGCGIRVPVINGSFTDLTCILKKPAGCKDINKAFKKAAQGSLKGILEYTDDPIVSVDVIGNPHSCIFDSELTSVIGRMVKVTGWYDNEAGYSNRLAELVERIG